MKSNIAVVIPTYNCGRYIDQMLASVLVQTVVPDEIIIVDDASTDDTLSRLQRYKSSIKLISCKTNSGTCSVPRNIGIEASRSRFIVPFDADDLMHPRKIERHAAALKAFPDAEVQFHDFECFGEPGAAVPSKSFCTVNSCFLKHLAPLQDSFWLLNAPDAFETLMQEHYIGGGAILFSKNAWQSVGGYDPLLASAEDRDFCIKLAQSHAFVYIDELLYRYRIHNAGKTGNKIENYECAIAVLKRYRTRLMRRATRRAMKKLISEMEFELVWQHGDAGHPAAAFKHWLNAVQISAIDRRALRQSAKLARHCATRVVKKLLGRKDCAPKLSSSSSRLRAGAAAERACARAGPP